MNGSIAALLLVLGIVLSPLRAEAAIRMFITYDVAVGRSATTGIGTCDAVRSEAEQPSINAHDRDAAALFRYDDPRNLRVVVGAGAARAYDGALDHAQWREVDGDGRSTTPPPPRPTQRGLGRQVPKRFRAMRMCGKGWASSRTESLLAGKAPVSGPA